MNIHSLTRGILLTALAGCCLPRPVVAGGFDPDRVERIRYESLNGWRTRGLAVGVSFRVPLASDATLRPERTEMRLDFGFRQTTMTGSAPVGSGVVHRPLYRLSMRLDDPKSLAINGMRLRDLERLAAGEGPEDASKDGGRRHEGGINWWWVGGGVAFLVAGGVAAGAAAGSAGKAAGEALNMAIFCLFNKKDPRCRTGG